MASGNPEPSGKQSSIPYEVNLDFSVKILMPAEFSVKDMDLLV